MSQKQYAYFSAAIRGGIRLARQGFGAYFSEGKACAMATGAFAMFGELPRTRYVDEIVDSATSLHPYMMAQRYDLSCPTNPLNRCCRIRSLSHGVTHLNDTHRWTREQIADWLYAEEEKLGFVTISDETEARKIPEAGRGDSVVTEAQAGVLTKRF